MLTEEGQAELSVLQGADDDTMKSFAGCTSAVVLVTRNEVYCANAGDSRSVMAQRNTAKDLSVDHKPDDPGELARIEASGNYVEQGRVNGRLALSRALGDFEYKNNADLPAKKQAVSALPDLKMETITPDT